MPFYCLPVVCHEISGQWRTSQFFSPLSDNSVKLGSSRLMQWEVLTEDGLGGSLFVCLFLTTLMSSYNPNTHHYWFPLPLLMTIISPEGLIQSFLSNLLFNTWFLPSRYQSEGNDSEGQKMRGPIRRRTPSRSAEAVNRNRQQESPGGLVKRVFMGLENCAFPGVEGNPHSRPSHSRKRKYS